MTGDVVGSEVIIGEKGRVTGVVSGESVIVRGEVAGTIRGLRVVLQSGAKVEGDVHHQVLSVEQGAFLDGRVRRPNDANELRPILDPSVAGHSEHGPLTVSFWILPAWCRALRPARSHVQKACSR